MLLAALLVQPHLPAGTLWPQILETEVHLPHRPVGRHPLAPSPAVRRHTPSRRQEDQLFDLGRCSEPSMIAALYKYQNEAL